jgi:hypothetical protein
MSSQNIYPKPCVYNCGIQIFWNAATSEYLEVFTKKKHICPNRVSNKPSHVTTNTNTSAIAGTAATTNTKPTYYSKKPWNTQPKPKMSNSFELLTGPVTEIQKKYEILSDIVIVEYGGKVHGSQSHIVANNNSMQLIVYYEVPLGMRDEVKQKFNNKNKSIYILDS